MEKDNKKEEQNHKYKQTAERICQYVLSELERYRNENKGRPLISPVDDLSFVSSLTTYVQTHLIIAHKSGSDEEKAKELLQRKEVKNLESEIL